MADAILLRDLAAKTRVLDIACSRCTRRGRYSVPQLTGQHGADMPVPDLLRRLSADCPNRNNVSFDDRCDPYAPGLAGLFGMKHEANGAG